jgi:uracil-DNA glycosylase family 4
MDERHRRAWDALGIGPAWTLRDPPLDARPAAGTDLPTGVPARSDASAPVDDASPRAMDGASERNAAGHSAAPEEGGPLPLDEQAAIALASAPTEPSRREAAIAGLGWTALGAAVSGCTACGLCASRRNTVFGAGGQPVGWMLVGEAPGEQEDLRGEPFVGPAGGLLDQMLASIGVDRARDAFIANVLKCRPPGNRNPTPEEVARCEPYLLRQVELVRPRLIVVLGRFAAQSLLRTEASIASLRGRVHAYRAGGREVPMVVTYHPAYLLRTLPDKAKAWADLRLARRTFDAAGD